MREARPEAIMNRRLRKNLQFSEHQRDSEALGDYRFPCGISWDATQQTTFWPCPRADLAFKSCFAGAFHNALRSTPKEISD